MLYESFTLIIPKTLPLNLWHDIEIFMSKQSNKTYQSKLFSLLS